jgi:hypothetical protein
MAVASTCTWVVALACFLVVVSASAAQQPQPPDGAESRRAIERQSFEPPQHTLYKLDTREQVRFKEGSPESWFAYFILGVALFGFGLNIHRRGSRPPSLLDHEQPADPSLPGLETISRKDLPLLLAAGVAADLIVLVLHIIARFA